MAGIRFESYMKNITKLHRVLHIAASAICAILVILLFFSELRFVFVPVIFIVTSLTMFFDSYENYTSLPQTKKKSRAAMRFLILGILSLALSVLTAIFFW